ncbi:MAG: ATP-dependent Clp protease proteolytic subunit [Xanthobacteraceae bacterium]|nr:ATP-dependent Clp protease proteolytic subunit [Xanthobacteraceae bacterium]
MPLRWAASSANFWRAMSGVAISLAQLSLVSLVHAAEFTSAVSKEGRTILLLDGRIEPGDSMKLALMVTALDNQNRAVSALYLNSPGGKGDDAQAMAALVKHHKISTIVADGAKCASACFIVFAAGHKKFADDRAQIGVHRASEKGQETGRAFAATAEMARTVSELGVPPAVVGKLVSTPPDRVVWLSLDDLRSMNVTITSLLRWPLPVAPPLPAVPLQLTLFKPVVKPEGLSWPEYVAVTSELSRRQFGPDTFRDACNLHTMLCSRSFKFIDKDKLRVEVATVEDLSGNVVRREICKLGTGPAVRTCFDWDTLETSHAAQDKDGRWKNVPGKTH